MADFAILWESRHQIVEECDELLRDCEENKDRECNAVTLVQRNFRGSLCRTVYKSKRFGVIEVQRLFRGFRGRTCVLQELAVKQHREQMAYFHCHASLLQKMERGYHSRTYVHDFFSRKAYIQSVVEKSNLLRRQLATQRENFKKEDQERKIREAQEEFKAATASLHHLISTKSCLGVYRSPFSADLEPKAFGVPIEQHLRNTTRQILRTEGLRTTRKRQRRKRLSVQAQSEYDTVLEAERAASRYSKMRMMSKKDFVAGGKVPHSHGAQTSISHGTEYVELWKATRQTGGRDQFADRPPFYSSVCAPKIFDEVADRQLEEQEKFKPRHVLHGR